MRHCPSTLRLDREKERAVYFRAGAREIWFARPERQRLEVHLPGGHEGEAARTLGVGEALDTPLLPGWSCAVGEVFG